MGEEQSGQIYEIGYGMYTSMLSKAIRQVKGDMENKEQHHIEIDAYESSLIPQDYIDDIFIRLQYYSEIANLNDEYELGQVITKLEDIYGPIPEFLENLISLTKVRIFAKLINATKIKINKDTTEISIAKDNSIDHNNLINKFVLTKRVELIKNERLKYKNIKDEIFLNICNDLIEFIKLITI